MARKWQEEFAVKATTWKIPPADVTELTGMIAECSSLYAEVKSSFCTKGVITQCRVAFKNLVTKMRYIKRHYLLAPPLTPENFTALGLKVPTTTRNSIPVLNEVPELIIRPGDFRQLVFDFHVRSTGKKSIPYGHNGAVLYWKVGGPAPTKIKEFNNSELQSVTHFSIWFDEEDRGQVVHFAMCWENQRGKKGPMSEIQSQIVP
jgi:hypothetical protein